MNYYQKYLKYKSKYLKIKGGMSYEFHVSKPWFAFIESGEKTTEGRLNKTTFAELKPNDIVTWFNIDDQTKERKECKTKITNVNHYQTFREMILAEGIENVLPGIDNIDDGVGVYRKYYTSEAESQYGVLAIQLELIKE